jgi:hypothetical protein
VFSVAVGVLVSVAAILVVVGSGKVLVGDGARDTKWRYSTTIANTLRQL